jgi:RND family efflux transporter MFP subunit
LAVGVLAALALAAAAYYTRGLWAPNGAVAQAPPQAAGPRAVAVVVATAQKKKVPLHIDALGTVTPVASVAIKSRIETVITGVHFQDGAMVNEGDLLITLDSRAIEAQIRQAEATLARDRAQLEGAERDLQRYTDLVAKSATPVTNLDNARTQTNVFRAAVRSTEAQLENLKVQLSYCTIRAPISGRASMAAVKAGNFVRPADPAPIATIIQAAPIYVTFSIPQNELPLLREALAAETATVQAAIPGDTRRSEGQVTMIENTVDPASGMVAVRATMPNKDELLWPGTLVRIQLTVREEMAVTVPPRAVQVSQEGPYVFVVENGVARVRKVEVARTMEQEAVIAGGLQGGEAIVTEGQLRLTDGTRVAVRGPRTGS